MLTITQAFEKFRQRLELSETERKDAARKHTDVRDCIRGGFDIAADFLSGSYSRHTKTKPLKDVDVMFVLGSEDGWRREKSPTDTLDAFVTCLKSKFAGKGQVTRGRRSVTVEFEKLYYPEDHDGRVLSIDAVPAFDLGKEVYEIADAVSGEWIKTSPGVHQTQATAKNKSLDGRWVPLVKMAKGWNRAHDKPVKPSFLVEVMAEKLAEGPFSNYPDEIRNLFAAMESTIGDTWPDPAGMGPPVSDQMTAELVAVARAKLHDAQRLATLARRAEQMERQGEALRIWRDVLGDYFPLS